MNKQEHKEYISTLYKMLIYRVRSKQFEYAAHIKQMIKDAQK
jgi:hypothetical protein